MNRLKDIIVKFAVSNNWWLKWISNFVNIVAIGVLILWILDKKLNIYGQEFDQEPVFTILMLMSVIINRLYLWLLDEAEYSPVHALAVGYVSNFLSPSITQLIQNGVKYPKVWIYRPENIAELSRDSVDRIKGELVNAGFDLDVINLELRHARTRDILMVQKSKTKNIFFDFPNTLLSIQNYVDYKVESKSNRSSEEMKKLLMLKLIDKFFDKILEMAKKEGIDAHLCFCDKNLQLKFD